MRKHISTFLLAFLVYSGIAANAQDILWMSDYSVLTARFHPTEDYVYTSQEWLGIVKRDKFTGDSLELISDFPAMSMEFSKDGKMLAAGNDKGKLLVLDVETKETLMEE
jgi:tricorn protease-like protein